MSEGKVASSLEMWSLEETIRPPAPIKESHRDRTTASDEAAKPNPYSGGHGYRRWVIILVIGASTVPEWRVIKAQSD